MAVESWLCLGGTELANNSRTVAYARTGAGPRGVAVYDLYPGLPALLGDAPYTTPAADGAAWYDPAIPASAGFGGLYITNLSGLDSAPYQRPVVDRTSDGAVLGRPRYGARTIQVTGILIGRSCCSTAYGLAWLAAALRAGCADGPACEGDSLQYLAAMPSPLDSPGTTVPWRTLQNVGMTDGVTISDRYGGASACGTCGGCPMMEVQFTLTAATPWAYWDPTTVLTQAAWTSADLPQGCITWVHSTAACSSTGSDCPDVATMPLYDPSCPPSTTIPDLPIIEDDCACLPLSRRRKVIAVPAADVPVWLDAVPVMELFSGNTPLRNVRLRWYQNPLGRTTPDDIGDCAWCSEVNISYVPASSSLGVDGTRQQLVVTLPGGGVQSAAPVVSGPSGGPLLWPTMTCGTPYLISIEAETSSVDAAAWVSLDIVPREV